LEQTNGWLLSYGGCDGSDTPNDRVYNVSTADFLSFGNRALVIDHGQFQNVNNVNVRQLSDGALHMICTVLKDGNSLDKPAYFSSPDGTTWNGMPEPYAAQWSDSVSISNDPNYAGWDFNGGNVLVWDNNEWSLYYSVGIYGAIGQVYRATSNAPPAFQKTGVALGTQLYADSVEKFQLGGTAWYTILLYQEEAAAKEFLPSITLSLNLTC
jgi:hypothetical protein